MFKFAVSNRRKTAANPINRPLGQIASNSSSKRVQVWRICALKPAARLAARRNLGPHVRLWIWSIKAAP